MQFHKSPRSVHCTYLYFGKRRQGTGYYFTGETQQHGVSIVVVLINVFSHITIGMDEHRCDLYAGHRRVRLYCLLLSS